MKMEQYCVIKIAYKKEPEVDINNFILRNCGREKDREREKDGVTFVSTFFQSIPHGCLYAGLNVAGYLIELSFTISYAFSIY